MKRLMVVVGAGTVFTVLLLTRSQFGQAQPLAAGFITNQQWRQIDAGLQRAYLAGAIDAFVVEESRAGGSIHGGALPEAEGSTEGPWSRSGR